MSNNEKLTVDAILETYTVNRGDYTQIAAWAGCSPQYVQQVFSYKKYSTNVIKAAWAYLQTKAQQQKQIQQKRNRFLKDTNFE